MLASWLKKIYTRRTLSASSRNKGPIYFDVEKDWDKRLPERPQTVAEEKMLFGGVPGPERIKELITGLIEQQVIAIDRHLIAL